MPKGYLWIGTDNSLQLFDPTQQRFYTAPNKTLQHGPCIPLWVQDDRLIVFKEGEGLGAYLFTKNEWRWIWHSGREYMGLMRYTIAKDKLFVSFSKGLLISLDAQLSHVDTVSNMWLSDTVQAIATEPDGEVNLIQGSRWLKTSGEELDPPRHIDFHGTTTALYITDHGEIWMGLHGKGIYCRHLDGSIELVWSDPRYSIAEPVYCFYEDGYGNLWAGVEAIGVVCFGLQNALFDHYTMPDLQSNFVKCFAEDNDGQWWIGYHEHGVQVINPSTGEITIPEAVDRLKNVTVFNLKATSDGAIWLNTAQGMFRYNKGRMVQDNPPGHPHERAEAIWTSATGQLQGIWNDEKLHTKKGQRWVDRSLSLSKVIRTGMALRDGRIVLGTMPGCISWIP